MGKRTQLTHSCPCLCSAHLGLLLWVLFTLCIYRSTGELIRVWPAGLCPATRPSGPDGLGFSSTLGQVDTRQCLNSVVIQHETSQYDEGALKALQTFLTHRWAHLDPSGQTSPLVLLEQAKAALIQGNIHNYIEYEVLIDFLFGKDV